MKKRLGRIVTGVVGAVVGTGGSAIAGLEIEYAVIVGFTALVLIIGGKEAADFFFNLVKKDKDK